jgi:hypothetical protein
MPYLVRMNWRACNFAAQYGFACADSFAQYMGADYDSNSDGQIDSDALRYVQGESESAYVNRITVTLRSTVRDANTHFVNGSTSYDYIQSDNTHPTYTGSTIYVGPVRRHRQRLRRARLQRRADRGRQESGVEPVRPRAHGVGALRLQPRDTLTAKRCGWQHGCGRAAPDPLLKLVSADRRGAPDECACAQSAAPRARHQ